MKIGVPVPMDVRAKGNGPRYLTVSPSVTGCHAEGDSFGEGIDNLRDVARTLLEIMREDSTPITDGGET